MGGGAIAERRLRPLWDAIDLKQYKTALKLASALQSKHPDAPYVLILKSLVLERLGKPDEALVLCRQAKQMQPTDDLSLSAMELVFQRLGSLEEAIQVYESACVKSPGNVELLVRLFNCHLRQRSYVKQQQVAMKIYKLTGDDKYLMWAVCSIYAQVRPGNSGESKLLTLAEGLIKKMIQLNGLYDLEALRFYVILLLNLDKHEEALGVLSGSLGELFTMPVERLEFQGDILMVLQRFSEAAAVYREILSISPDNWNAIRQLINASLELPKNSSAVDRAACQMASLTISSEEACDRLEKVAELMRTLESSDMQVLQRGPSLAFAELEYRRILHGSGGTPIRLAECILKYFDRFGHLASFHSDVKIYLSALDTSSKDWIVNQLADALSGLADSSEPVKLLRRKVAVYQVEDQIGERPESLNVAREMVCLYLENLKYSADLDPEENIIGEELLVMTVNILLKQYLQTREFGLIIEAICVLEFGLSLRRWNYEFKIMLISLYSTIFAVTMAVDWFKALDVKNILFEIASHHVLPALRASFNCSELDLLLASSIKFHEDYQNEAADMAILAYKHGNYTGTDEFVELQHRLENSHHFLLARIELVILALKRSSEKLDAVEDILAKHDDGKKVLMWSGESSIASLTFNEDLDNRPWWSPLPDVNLLTGLRSDSAAEYQQRMRASLKRRSYIPRLLFLSISPSSSETNGLAARRDELKQLLECYLESLNLSVRTVADLAEYTTKTEPKDCDAELLSVLVFFLAWQLHSCSSSSPEVDEISRSMSFLNVLISTHVRSLLQPTNTSDFGTTTALLIKVVSEPINWLIVCVQAWMKRLVPVQKRKKKTLEAIDDKKVLKVVEGLRGLVAGVQAEVEAVNAWVGEAAGSGKVNEEAERFLVACSSSDVVQLLVQGGPYLSCTERWSAGDLCGRIASSRRLAVLDLGQLCGLRLKQLKSLK